MENLTENSEAEDRWAQRVAYAVAMGATILVVGLYAYWMIRYLPYSFDDDAGKILQEHYQAIIGLPAAGAVSFILVVFLRQTAGPIQFEGLGFKFSGAASQVVMWVVCFLAITGAIKMVW